ncbi:hypothetical protein ABBQ38_004600 [Trebouxia sp. C0009 RCD-2024]
MRKWLWQTVTGQVRSYWGGAGRAPAVPAATNNVGNTQTSDLGRNSAQQRFVDSRRPFDSATDGAERLNNNASLPSTRIGASAHAHSLSGSEADGTDAFAEQQESETHISPVSIDSTASDCTPVTAASPRSTPRKPKPAASADGVKTGSASRLARDVTVTERKPLSASEKHKVCLLVIPVSSLLDSATL